MIFSFHSTISRNMEKQADSHSGAQENDLAKARALIDKDYHQSQQDPSVNKTYLQEKYERLMYSLDVYSWYKSRPSGMASFQQTFPNSGRR